MATTGRNRSEDQLQIMIQDYDPIIRKVCRQYRGQADADDLRQAACIGVWEAQRTFDESKGSFPSWVKLHVKRAVHDEVRRNGRAIRLPNNQHQAVTEIRRAAQAISASGRTVTGEALAEGCDRPLGDVVALSPYLTAPSSLEATTEAEDGSQVTLGDKLGVIDPGYGQIDFFELLDSLDGYLSDGEREAFTLRFGLLDGVERSYREVAAEMATSPYLAQKQCENALKTLRHPAVADSILEVAA